MTDLIAVDASVRSTGVALFFEGRLVACNVLYALGLDEALVHVSTTWPLLDVYGAKAAIEFPMIYPITQRQGDPNDLLPLAAVAGAWGARFPAHVYYRPHEWKGQTPKPIMSARIRETLDAAERDVFDAASTTHKRLAHNAHDAIGIGLHALGRMRRV